MEDITTTASSSSTIIQQRLKFILQSQPELWVYSIFWRAMEDGSGKVVLSWGDGHFHGNKSCNAVGKNRQSQHVYGNNFEKMSNTTNFQGSYLKEEMDIDRLMLENANDGEFDWFYLVSRMQWFAVGDGIVGEAFSRDDVVWLTGDDQLKLHECGRVKEVYLHGIKTLTCISTPGGVVELGSSDLINQNWGLVQLTRSLFGADNTRYAGFSLKLSNNDFQFPISDSNAASSSCLMGIISGLEKEGSPEKEIEISETKKGTLISQGSLSTDSDYKKRARKQPGSQESSVDRVKAERQRRKRLNERFYALRSVVPNVSKMDKASLLADAVTSIKELKSKADKLESELKQVTKVSNNIVPCLTYNGRTKTILEVDVKVAGTEAMISVRSPNVNYPAARLMDALRDLEFQIYHASVTVLNDMVHQGVVVKIPDGVTNENTVRTAILQKMHN